ncbi:MAG: chromosomal replication initiator protein DnaA [Spirochaetales bacterium]|nr:chromosomal replication initiator protein DnaA [Spirochaetales bacterium]
MSEQQWDYSIFWKEAANQIKEQLSEQEWVMWFDNISYNSSNESSVILNVPSSFYRDQVKQRYQKLIQSKLLELSGHNLGIDFNIIKLENKEIKPADADPSDSGIIESKRDNDRSPFEIQRPSPIKSNVIRSSGLNEVYNFDRYVIGENNSFAANAAYAISRNPGTAYNPCLIYGGVGLGKTHLLQAIGNSASTANSDLKVSYVTAETFTNEFIKAIGDKKAHIFKNKYRNVDILLIDDIHFIQGKDATQEELFHTFNALYDANKQMVFTCDRPVSELKKLTDRLRNRFERGLNVDLQPPNFETRFAILKKKIEQKKVPLSDEIISFVCKNITTNVRDLEAALMRLIAYAELVNKEITMEIAQQQLKDTFSTQKQGNISIELIQRVVSDYFNMSQSDLKGKRRNKAIVLPRQVAMYIVRDLTEFSTTEIGLEFGGRDHTTVMHACQRIEIHMNTNPTLEPTIRNLIRTIQEQSRM